MLRRAGGDLEVTRHPVAEGLRALRPHQWAKNLLVFVPLALTPEQIGEPALELAALCAFAAFSLGASAGYLVNDLLDLEADRSHPEKRHRPFASGALGTPAGIGLALALVLGAFALSASMLPRAFAEVLATYLALTLLYSAFLKRFLMLDVILLAGLYSLRLIGGAAAVAIELTPWLLAFALFIFLSLAFAKRYSELQLLAAKREVQVRGRAYRVEDLDLVAVLGASSGYMSVLVLCLYINSDAIRGLYRTEEMLWFLCPILLYWISRIWFLAKRGDLPGDPVAFAVRDPVSWISGGLMGAFFALAVS